MNNNPAIKYGIIGSVLLLVFGILIQLLMLSYLESAAKDPNNFSFGKFLLYGILSLVFIVIVYIYCISKSMKDYRKLDPDYTYRKLVGQGLIVTLILVLVSTGLSYLYNNVVTPESKEKTLELTKQVYQNITTLTEEQKEKAIERLNDQNPVRTLLSTIGISLMFGLIVSLISASVLNAKNKMNNPQQLR